MPSLHVELVSPERVLWSGEASQVSARTLDGEIGILPGHSPLLGVLAEGGVVTIAASEAANVMAAVHGGFVSLSDDRLSIIAEVAELGEEVDVRRAQEAIARAEAAGDDDEAARALARAQARLRAAGQLD